MVDESAEPHAFPTHGSGVHPEADHPPSGDQTEPADGAVIGEASADENRAARIAARQAERAAAAEVSKAQEAETAQQGTVVAAPSAPPVVQVATPRIRTNPNHSTGPTDEPPYPGYGR